MPAHNCGSRLLPRGTPVSFNNKKAAEVKFEIAW